MKTHLLSLNSLMRTKDSTRKPAFSKRSRPGWKDFSKAP